MIVGYAVVTLKPGSDLAHAISPVHAFKDAAEREADAYRELLPYASRERYAVATLTISEEVNT